MREREAALAGADAALPLTRAVATQLRKLMAYKDEYEVARLYTDGEFEKRIAEEFEGDDLKLEFYMAPPALVKPKGGRAAAPRKVRFGPWLLPVLKVLARGKGLRGTAFDPFGRTEERRLERRLIAEYEARVDELLRRARCRASIAVAVAIANVPASIRGYGHVKLASLAIARARESELLNRFDPAALSAPGRPGGGRAVPRHSGDVGLSRRRLCVECDRAVGVERRRDGVARTDALHFCDGHVRTFRSSGRPTGEPGPGGAAALAAPRLAR